MDGQRRSWTGLLHALSVLLGVLWLAAAPAAAQTMIIGIDEKVTWDAKGKQLFTDYLALYRFDDGWKIVAKTFFGHP